MAKLTFSVLGYMFERGLQVFGDALNAASDALEARVSALEQELADYDAAGVFDGERDDRGYVIWHRGQLLEHDIDTARVGVFDLRKAFALAAYHHWERCAQQWVASHPKSHDPLAAKLMSEGFPIHPRLADVRDLANALKHNKQDAGRRLVERWPSLFWDGFHAGDKHIAWYDVIYPAREQMAELFQIIQASGPTAAAFPS